MQIPDWLIALSSIGQLTSNIFEEYAIRIEIYDLNDPDFINRVIGCSVLDFEIGGPKATTTTTLPPDPEHNLVVETCKEDSGNETLIELNSLLMSPYPIIFHPFISYDLFYDFNITDEINENATVSVAIKGKHDGEIVPIPCFTELAPYDQLNDTCTFTAPQVCDFLQSECVVGSNKGKINMKVNLLLGSLVMYGHLDDFIAGIYQLEVNILNPDVVGCFTVEFEVATPPSTIPTTTTTKTTTMEANVPNHALVKKPSYSLNYNLSFMLAFFMYTNKN